MKTITAGKYINCLPCPFCESTSLCVTDWQDDNGQFDAIACLTCDAEAPVKTWNRRPGTDITPEIMVRGKTV